MHCPQCGMALNADAKFCAGCGTRVAAPVAAPIVQNQYAPMSMNGNFSDKSKVVAGLLQIFLGSFGVGRFYTGHVGLAIGQIAATWLTCGIGAIWPFIDGIIILFQDDATDAQGRRLRP